MHVMLSANSAWNIWNFRRSLVRALFDDGHHVSVLAPPDGSVPELLKLGCDFLPLEMDVKGLNPAQDLLLLRRLKIFFERQRPDIVLGFTIKNNIFGSLAARMVGVPFVPNVTGLGTAFLRGGLLQSLVERLYRHSFSTLPLVFFQNQDDLSLFVSRRLVKTSQACLLPGSGVDLLHFPETPLPPPDVAPVFLMIGRLLRDKGVVEYVEAARLVKAQVPDAKFLLLGATGSENRSAINSELLRSWIEEEVIEYLGTTNDVRPHIAEAHCVVLPSYREGAPRTLIEAAAMSRPVIATDVAGCRSVVAHQETGFLCAVRDAESLSKTIFQFLELEHAAWITMGKAGRSKMELEFDHSIILTRYREAVNSLCSGHRARCR